MKVIYSHSFYPVYTSDPAAEAGRIEAVMNALPADIIGISAGFDHHIHDWGGLLFTRDYYAMGKMVANSAREGNGGCFAILEGAITKMSSAKMPPL